MPTIKRKYTGTVKSGKRGYAPYIMRAIDRGAMPEDVRAESAGLLTPITKRGKRDIKPVQRKTGENYKAVLAAREAEKASKRRIQAMTRMLANGEITIEQLQSLAAD